MILVVINWLCMLIAFLGWGGMIHYLFCRTWNLDPTSSSLAELILTGMGALLVFSNLISIWWPVNATLLYGYLPSAILFFIIARNHFRPLVEQWYQRYYSAPLFIKWSFILLFAIALIETIGPSEIADEGGYHLPLVRWTEQYGLIPGIANIEDRMGFNPAVYILNAVFNLRGLIPGGTYDLNSFLFLVIGAAFLYRIQVFWRDNRGLWLPALFGAGALVFLFRAYLSAMDADFLNIFGGLFFLGMCLDLLVLDTDQKSGYSLLFLPLFFCVLVANKFSIGLLAPFAAWAMWLVMKREGLRATLGILVIGTVITGTWVWRNYYISGYPIYPLYFLDWWRPEWKVPLQLAQGQYAYVGEYARLEETRPFNTYVIRDLPWELWGNAWLQRLWEQLLGKVVLLGVPLSGLLVMGRVLFQPVLLKTYQRYFLYWLFLAIAIVVWWLRIPAVRFAWPWLFAFMAISFGIVCGRLIDNHRRHFRSALVILLLASLLRSSISSFAELPRWWNYWLYPHRVEEGRIHEVLHWNAIDLNVCEDNFCRDVPVPCLPRHYHPGLRLIGPTLQSGFKIEQ